MVTTDRTNEQPREPRASLLVEHWAKQTFAKQNQHFCCFLWGQWDHRWGRWGHWGYLNHKIDTLVTGMYPCSTKTREVLGNPSPTPERFPETREISRGRSPREISRVEGNLEGRGDGFINNSQVLVEYGHSIHHQGVHGIILLCRQGRIDSINTILPSKWW